jgi:hypothetical protein
LEKAEADAQGLRCQLEERMAVDEHAAERVGLLEKEVTKLQAEVQASRGEIKRREDEYQSRAEAMVHEAVRQQEERHNEKLGEVIKEMQSTDEKNREIQREIQVSLKWLRMHTTDETCGVPLPADSLVVTADRCR